MIAVLGGRRLRIGAGRGICARGALVALWARDAAVFAEGGSRQLPGVQFPPVLGTTTDLWARAAADMVLPAVPAQALAGFRWVGASHLDGRHLVACCKVNDLESGRRPAATIGAVCPQAWVALLTGPGFAADIAAGMPTAMTLARADAAARLRLQAPVHPRLRLYRTTGAEGAKLGGAMQNVIAIAAGVVIGAGLGLFARAALMTRGHAEMLRLALAFGARREMPAGLSRFGDLVRTCTSDRPRNFRFRLAVGSGTPS